MELVSRVTGQIEVDALPYIDPELAEEGNKQLVEQLIQEEMNTFTPPNYLESFQEPKLSFPKESFLWEEYNRYLSGSPPNALDFTQYMLPQPSDEESVIEWHRARSNAEAQIEFQYSRQCNLEILSKYGPKSWGALNEDLSSFTESLRHRLDRAKEEKECVNKRRKLMQVTEGGEELRVLMSQWSEVVSNNRLAERKCDELEGMIRRRKVAKAN